MHLAQFLDYLILEKNYSKHTYIAYEKDLKLFFTYCNENLDEIDVDKIHYNQIRNWIVFLVESGKSNRTINRKIASLKAYYKFLVKIEILDKSPLIKHKALKTSKRIQIPFSTSEITEVINTLKKEKGFKATRDLLIIELFYGTGIRRSELIELKCIDVDDQKKQIKVIGKRNKERIVPLLPSLIDSLKRYLIYREEVIEEQENEYLFITNKGVKIYETLVYRVINSYFSRASIKVKKSPHILRHSFATHLLNEGANLNAVKELLGHSSLAATEVYTHQSITKLNKVYKKSHPRNKK